VAAARRKAARQPLTSAESFALAMLHGIAGDGGRIEPSSLLEFGQYTASFDAKLEAHAAAQGWFVEAPSKTIGRYSGRSALEIGAGIVTYVVSGLLAFSGLAFVAVGLVAGGVVSMLIAREMPARTRNGALIDAQLKAYRRTLEATMDQARSMNEVVESAKLAWLDSPDLAVVWGVALGLNQAVQAVLGRTVEDVQRNAAGAGAYFPLWYGSGAAFGGFQGGSPGAGSLFSSGGIPDVGGMMSALGTIGNSPATSGGGGFGGGGSGGGGGGAGGGF
jgi:hypothetical protein